MFKCKSTADELQKFKKLLDDGIITQEEFNAKNEELSLNMMATRYASTFINDLYERANVKDNRYLYF